LRIVVTERIHRPAEEVFETLANPDIYLSRWAKGVLSAKRLKSAEPNECASYQVIGRDVTGKVKWRYEMTHSEPHLLSGRATGGPVAFTESFRLEMVGTVTNIEFVQELEPRGMFRAMGPLVNLLWPRLMQQNLRSLKRLVESRTPARQRA
jgi:carbon monoxide dehydrogenase subunit G